MRIEITPGTEHGVKLIRIEERENLFYDAFLQASEALTEILHSSETSGRNPASYGYPDFYGYPNNLITFCGDRGQGKTSAMLSFARALNERSPLDKFEGGRFDGIKNTRFVVMPAIDPTILEERQNILTVILSRLFLMVKNEWDSRRSSLPHQGDDRDRRDLIEAFQRCMDGVDAVKGSQKELPLDGLEQLEQLGDSSQLKKSFHRLISLVLELSCGENVGGQRCLVIQLDDTDLQFEQAYDILEDLRKHLAIPNVVILMATDMEQLRELVVHHYEQYVPNRTGQESSKLRGMANKYLDKLIPSRRTVYLPQFEERCLTDTTLTLSYGTHIEEMPFQEGILKYIRKKTGIIFLSPTSYLHNIIPNTFRGLVHFLNFLAAMEDIPEIVLPEDIDGSYFRATAGSTGEQKVEMFEQATRTARRNLKLFENYFLHEWCVDKLDAGDCEKLREVDQSAPNQRIRRLLETVCCRRHKNLEDLSEQTDYLKLVAVLEDAKKDAGEKDYRFYFAVHTYLTIQLHKLMWRCRAETLDQCRQALAANDSRDSAVESMVFDYERLKERIGPRLFRYERNEEHERGGNSDYGYYEFTIDEKTARAALEEEPDTSALLLRSDDAGTVFCAGQIFFGILCSHSNIAQGIKDFYFAQECALNIILNWDVQDKIYKEKSFFETAEIQLGQRANMFAGRYERLLSFLCADNKDEQFLESVKQHVTALSDREKKSFLTFLGSQGLQGLWLTAVFLSQGFLKEEAERMQRALVQTTQGLEGKGLELLVGGIKGSKTFFTDGYSIYEAYKKYPHRADKLPSNISQVGEIWDYLKTVMREYTEENHSEETGGSSVTGDDETNAASDSSKGKKESPDQRKRRYLNEFREKENDLLSWEKDSLIGLFQDYLDALEKACGQSSEPEKDS